MANIRNDAGVYFAITFTFVLMIQCSMSFGKIILFILIFKDFF